MAETPVIRQIQSFLPITQEIVMINSYRGVPISYSGYILGADDQTIQVKVHKYQAVCIELTKQTFFKNDHLPIVRGRVIGSNLGNLTVTLGALEYAEDEVGNRQSIRVSPKETVEVVIRRKDTGHQITTSLVDISVVGVGVYWISVFLQEIHPFRPHTEVIVSLNLPSTVDKPAYEIKLLGSVVHVQRLDGIKNYRLGLQIIPDKKTREQIQDYVFDQQNEIIREIKMVYDVMLRLANQKSIDSYRKG